MWAKLESPFSDDTLRHQWTMAAITEMVGLPPVNEQQLHHHITAKGIYYTEQDDIPDIAFTIMRGVGWFGCIACVLAAGLLGPAAFIGAGASALLAWKIKDMTLLGTATNAESIVLTSDHFRLNPMH